MSRFHVPVPDYDFTVRQKNPYIPTPDYTMKAYKPKNRPSLNSIGTEFSRAAEPQPSFQRARLPRLPDENSNFPEIKKHSYIEDREEEEPRISTKEHIKQIGVPVLPGIAVQSSNYYEISAPVASDQNRAFLRHLENHKKFDNTLEGDRGIDDCEICQIMRKQLEAEQSEGHHSSDRANSVGRRKRADIRDVFPRVEEQLEPAPYFRSISARARHTYEMRREGEVSIRAMEPVEILHMEREFALCRKGDNTIGWIPSSVFEM